MSIYRVKPGKKVDLREWDPRDRSLCEDKKEGKKRVVELNQRLEELQELLYAEGKRRLLIVLQALDTAGKDSTIRHVFDGTNPQGVKVAKFGRPTEQELAHDYLWRVHPHVPASGEIVIFNRSHYEDVLVVRVHNIVPEERWRRRYDHINAFEKLLADEGTTILKFFLHISPEEQAERLQERIDNPEKHWKFQHGDIEERMLWRQYRRAYQECFEKTSTDHAPWFIVPADRKWYRNLVISQILVDTLERFKMKFPPAENLDGITIPDVVAV